MTLNPDLLAQYSTALNDYLHTTSEEALYRASLLSYSFIEYGLGPEEIVALHAEELERVVEQVSVRARASLYASSLQFLLEVMIAYGIRYKEYTDLKLSQTILGIEQRMEMERALAEERIRVEAEALHSKEEFLGFIAHELRTPLAALHGYIQLLQRHQQSPERLRQSLEGMAHATQGMRRLVNNLVEISGAEAEVPVTEPLIAVDLGAMVREMTSELGVVAEQTGVAIEVQGADGLSPVRANPQALESVISNLLINAIKYSRPGGWVRVNLSAADGEVRCAVADEGIGIAPDDLPHIFDKYYRGANAAVVSRGIGLGLAVSQATVERYGGRLEVHSELDVGSTFTLALPVTAANAPDC